MFAEDFDALTTLKRLTLVLMLGAAIPLAACSDQGEGTTTDTAVESEDMSGEDMAAAGDEMADEAQVPAHEQIAWDLSDIFADRAAWDEARQWVLAQIPRLQEYQGHLGDDADTLLEALNTSSEVTQVAINVAIYAGMKSDEDQRISENQEMRQLSQQMFSEISQATAWTTPEILAIGEERINEFIASNPEGFERHRFGLENTLRGAAHTLSPEGERIMAASGIVTGQPYQTYSLLVNSDIIWPTVTLSDGREVTLNQSGYALYRAAPNREDRELVFDQFWGTWAEYQATIGQILNSHIQGQVFTARARNYDSALQMNLDQDNLPTAVYDTLVEQVDEHLPLFHRYLQLRTRLLGLDQMHYYDIYPEATELDREFSIEESRDLTLVAMEPLGEEYVSRLAHGTGQDWMHVYPQPGKRSGAYMNGSAYGIHPYLLLNHNDDYESFSTYAHEWGHAMHTIYSQEAQPWENAGYATFIAETASTAQELLAQEYLIEHAESDAERLFYVDRALEQYRGTLFRQTMFAEAEQAFYEEVEAGRPLTGERLAEIYLEIVRRYHGHDQGVLLVDDQIGMEFAYIPHFYFNFYVFQYSTSWVQANFFMGRVLDGEEGALEDYLGALSAGGSDYPYEIIREAGLDMASADAYTPTFDRFERLLDQYEALIGEMEQSEE